MFDFLHSPLAWVAGAGITIVVLWFSYDAIMNFASQLSRLVRLLLGNLLGAPFKNCGKFLGKITEHPFGAGIFILLFFGTPLYFFVWKPGAPDREIIGVSEKIATVYAHSEVDPTCFYEVDPYQKGSRGVYFATIADKSRGDNQEFHVDVVEEGTGLKSFGDGLRRDERLKFALDGTLWKVNSDNNGYVLSVLEQLRFLPACVKEEELFLDEGEMIESSDREHVAQEESGDSPEVAIKDTSMKPEAADEGVFSRVKEKFNFFWD